MRRTAPALLLLLLAACSSGAALVPLLPPDSQGSAGDSAAGDSAADPVDSGTPDDTGDEPVSDEIVVTAVPVTCADPALRSTLGPIDRVDLSDLVDLYPGDANGPPPASGSGVAVVDLDRDGLLDLLLPQHEQTQILMQLPDGSFADRTDEFWPADDQHASVAFNTVDIDDDGDVDLFACREFSTNALFVNDGTGRLTDVSAEWGVDLQDRACFNAAFGDMDGDGDLDLALGNNDPCPETDSGPDCEALLELPSSQVLWENEGGRFVDISDRLNHRTMMGSLMSVISWIDLDGDLDLDLLLTNDARLEVNFAEANVALRNDGNGQFADISIPSGLNVRMEGMGTAIGDLNDDGLPDFLITGTRDLSLLLSAEDFWYEADAVTGLMPSAPGHWFGWGTEFGDLDHDGDLDAPTVYGWLPPDIHDENPQEQHDALFLWDGEQFVDEAPLWGWDDPGYARGVAVVDLNGDGWLDLIKRELGGPLFVDLARCGEGSWVTVQVVQPAPNVDAVGAQIAVYAGGTVHRRWVLRGGTSISTALPTRVHVGLGDVHTVDRIEVTWPDGVTSVTESIDAQQHITITRQ